MGWATILNTVIRLNISYQKQQLENGELQKIEQGTGMGNGQITMLN